MERVEQFEVPTPRSPALASQGAAQGDNGDAEKPPSMRPAQHGPGPPGSMAVEGEEPVVGSHPGQAEQQIGLLQAELAAVKQSLANYETTLLQLLGAQNLPTSLQQLQQTMSAPAGDSTSSALVSAGAAIDAGSSMMASSLSTSFSHSGLQPGPADQQIGLTSIQIGDRWQQGLQTGGNAASSSSGQPGDASSSLQGKQHDAAQQQPERQQHVRRSETGPLSSSAARTGVLNPMKAHQDLQWQQPLAWQLQQELEGSNNTVRSAVSTSPRLIYGQGPSTTAFDIAAATSPAVQGQTSEPGSDMAGSVGPLGASSGFAGLQRARSTPTAGGVDAGVFVSLPASNPGGLLTGFLQPSHGLLSPVSGQAGQAAAGSRPTSNPTISPGGGLNPGVGSAMTSQTVAGTVQPLLGGLQAAAAGSGLTSQSLVPDTVGSLDVGPGSSTVGYAGYGLLTGALGAGAGPSAGTGLSEQDVVPRSAGDQFSGEQLQLMQELLQQQAGQEAAMSPAAAEQLLMLQQLQQQAGPSLAAAAAAAASVGMPTGGSTEQLLAAMSQLQVTDPATVAAGLVAGGVGQFGGIPGVPWGSNASAEAAAAAAMAAAAGGTGLEGITVPGTQQAVQALAGLNLQGTAPAQAELTALQQVQLAQQLQQQQQQQFNPYVQQQLLVAQAAAAAAAAAAVRQQQQQWQAARFAGMAGKTSAPGPSYAGSSGGRRGSRGSDVYPSGQRDAARSSSSGDRGARGSGGARSGRSASDPPDWRRVFVGNIGWWVDEDMLQRVFGEYGTILDAQVMWNTKLLAKGKRVNREFAFISFSSEAEAANAIAWMHGRYIEGLTKDKDGLTVQYEAQGLSKQGPQQPPSAAPAVALPVPMWAANPALQAPAAQQQQKQQLLLQQLQQQNALQQLLVQQQAQHDQATLLHQLQELQQQQQPGNALLLATQGVYGTPPAPSGVLNPPPSGPGSGL